MNDIQASSLLVVDDDTDLLDMLKTYLEGQGFVVRTATDGSSMKQAISLHAPDLIIMDLMLPGEDGLTLTRYIKTQGSTPVLMLSARGDEMDRVIGLEVGADDYMAKPFGPRELLARIRALLRRQHLPDHATQTSSLSFGMYRLQPESRSLWKENQIIELTSAEFDLLEVFVKRPLRVLSRDVLMDLLKGYERDPYDRSIDNRVTRLRKKIEIDPAHPTFIKTVRGEGYLFNPQG
ncbi:MAG: hypothetical protein RLZZ397_251 [Pseudomonadota bacterium]|jgi:two-component system phosphate regulon response regulator OmpR